ncbi:MAG: cbb3-type cytochrome c oxidase subunit II [Verrucomicrobia bacterium]|nr:cbb3-type cytochrome c oxidase subunit II [Verrucomicrobiota bacterium]
MKYGPLLFLGIFFTLASSWCGLVLMPQLQFGGLEPVKLEATGQFYPLPRSGLALEGLQVYRANGCIYCHSQQVRPADFGSDIKRGWGKRRSVSRDYIYDKPVMLGTMRTGPDLTNIGERQTSLDWQYQHLYNPQITSKGSIMPPFPFLFEQRRIGHHPSPDALKLVGEFAPPPGYEIVPTRDAKALVAYLLSLKSDVPLPEAPIPGAAPGSGTNAPAAGTNQAAATTASAPAK